MHPSPAAAARAFEQGGIYLYCGSMGWPAYGRALTHLKPHRDRMVLVLQSYARLGRLIGWSIERALRRIGYDYADCLLLGMWNHELSPRILDAALRQRERGLIRHIAISSHNRRQIAAWSQNGPADVLHLRYNAAHPGAESDIFPNLPPAGQRPGLVAFTATSWARLLDPRRIPAGERIPTAADCYRFVLSRPEVDVCLAGPKDDAQMAAIGEALRWGPLAPDEMAWMRRVGQAVRG
jgi:aryl-alcohol dehydrogenase-like predicted oxidoreductase